MCSLCVYSVSVGAKSISWNVADETELSGAWKDGQSLSTHAIL